MQSPDTRLVRLGNLTPPIVDCVLPERERPALRLTVDEALDIENIPIEPDLSDQLSQEKKVPCPILNGKEVSVYVYPIHSDSEFTPTKIFLEARCDQSCLPAKANEQKSE